MTTEKNEVRVYRGYYVVQDQEAGKVSILTRAHEFIGTGQDFDDAETIIDAWLDAR